MNKWTNNLLIGRVIDWIYKLISWLINWLIDSGHHVINHDPNLAKIMDHKITQNFSIPCLTRLRCWNSRHKATAVSLSCTSLLLISHETKSQPVKHFLQTPSSHCCIFTISFSSTCNLELNELILKWFYLILLEIQVLLISILSKLSSTYTVGWLIGISWLQMDDWLIVND